MNLYIITDKKETGDAFISSLNLTHFKKVYTINVDNKNTLGSYTRTTRIIAEEKGTPYRILVVFNSTGLQGEYLNEYLYTLTYACNTTPASKTIRIFPYTTDTHNEIVNKIQEFLAI